MNQLHALQRDKKQNLAFTLVEIVIIIAVLGILVGIAVVGFGGWRERTALTEVESGLSGVQAAMDDARNRSNSYPTFYTGTPFNGTNETKSLFRQTENTRITYVRGTATSYCVDVQSSVVPAVARFLEVNGSSVMKHEGTCDGGAGSAPPQPDETVFVFDTTAPGCTGTVQLPVTHPASGGTVDWGDGSTQARTASLQQHTYSTPGVYLAKYKGPMTAASYMAGGVNTTYAKCLTKVTQWANDATPAAISFYAATNFVYTAEPPQSVISMAAMFQSAPSFNQPIGDWDVSNVTNMGAMFQSAPSFNQPIGDWDVSNVTNMASMFHAAVSFNQPIGDWDISNVTNMASMFYAAISFNQPIGDWDVSNVTDMRTMFMLATSFNQPIGSWNTANVTITALMFNSATSFNQPIGSWNIANLTNMSSMFMGATSFNQPIGSWNTANVTNMNLIFQGATSFNQPIGSWNTANVTTMVGAFYEATSFNQPIGSWNTANVTSMASMFNSATSFNQPIGSWNTANVTNMADMFRQASSFNQNISMWNVAKVTAKTNFHLSSPLTQANCPPSLW